jgi:hypothetical protein
MTNEYPFVNQTILGEMFGATSHQVGKWLEDIGLRENKKPSWKAHQGGFVQTAPTGRAEGRYYFVWEKQKTVAALIEAGHSLDERPDDGRILRPEQNIRRGKISSSFILAAPEMARSLLGMLAGSGPREGR